MFQKTNQHLLFLAHLLTFQLINRLSLEIFRHRHYKKVCFINIHSTYIQGLNELFYFSRDSVLGPLCLAHQTHLAYIKSVVPKVIYEVRFTALEGHCVSSKGFPGSKGGCWEEEKRMVLPRREVIDLPSGLFYLLIWPT